MKIAILTNFTDFNPGYSLTGIVQDQVRMLKEHGHEVHLFVSEKCNKKSFPAELDLEMKVPFGHLVDYHSRSELTKDHEMLVKSVRAMIINELPSYDMVFTHDWVFTGWNLPYALGIIDASRDEAIKNVRWLHWIHSIPTSGYDWWSIREYGPKHRLVYPNKSDSIRVAEAYRGFPKDVRVVPHIKDLRSWFDFSEETCKFINQYPGVMHADIVQILPASVDRLEAKRVREVILLFKHLKSMGRSVCLVIANQWATTKTHKESIMHYKKIAHRNGLVPDEEVIFTSDFGKQYEVGIGKRMLRELFQCSNLFIFPTREETFGLVIPEASLAGGVMMVLNKSLQMQIEISGFNCLYFDFGSYCHHFTANDENAYFKDIAMLTLGRMQRDEAIAMKTFMRQRYNWDYLHDNYYAPIMSESEIW